MRFLGAGRLDGGALLATATPLRVGTTIAVCESRIEQAQRLVAKGTFSSCPAPAADIVGRFAPMGLQHSVQPVVAALPAHQAERSQRYLPLQGTERVLDIGSQVDQSRQRCSSASRTRAASPR